MVIVSQSALSHCCETIVMSTIINPYRKNKGGKCQANLQVKQVQKELETKKRKEPVWWYQNPKVKQAQKENTTTKPYSNSKPNGNDKKEDGDKCQPLWTWKPQQEEANREPPFRYNPVVLKKYTPDAVMTQFFNAVKSKKATHHHNHQGFPKKQCWFAANLDDHYYVNPEYVENFPMVVKMYKEDGLYFACRFCKLGPCVRVGIRWLIVKYCEETLKDHEKSGPEALPQMRMETERMMCYTMGQAFGKPNYTAPIYSKEGAPECTRNFILNYFLHARPELRKVVAAEEQVDLPHDDDFESDYTRPESKKKKEIEEQPPLDDDDRTIHSDEFEFEYQIPDVVSSTEKSFVTAVEVEVPKELACPFNTQTVREDPEESDEEYEFE